MTPRRFLGPAIFAALFVGAVTFAYVVTRRPAATTSLPTHDHASPSAASDRARPVTILAADANRIGVTYAPVTLEAVSHEVRAVAQVAADETRIATISPKLDGWVERLDVDFTGKEVHVGQPLLAIYSPMLVSAEEDLLLARKLGAGVRGGTSDAIDGASSLVESARARLLAWDVPPSEIRRLEETGTASHTVTLRSPVSGYVLEKGVVAGQSIMAGQSLFRVADLRSVWLVGEVFEQDLPAVRVGQSVTAEVQALPGETRSGRIAWVSPVLDAQTHTATIRVALPNPRLDLKPGMYATIRFTAAGAPNVPSVPRTAVLTTGERSLVFVKRADGKLEPHDVILGSANGERVQLLRGVAAGDTVVASATFLVDAESSLGTSMGGMGDMPGMDMTRPVPADSGGAPPRR